MSRVDNEFVLQALATMLVLVLVLTWEGGGDARAAAGAGLGCSRGTTHKVCRHCLYIYIYEDKEILVPCGAQFEQSFSFPKKGFRSQNRGSLGHRQFSTSIL